MINTLLKRRMENTKKNKKGFTLVELIVVLVIIAILAAVLVPTVSGYIKRANKTADQSAAKTAYTAYSAALTDWIGEHTAATTVTADEVEKIVKDDGYLSDIEIAKCTPTYATDGSMAITSFVYVGTHNNVTITIASTGEMTYSFTKKS